jgi:hypothetical protein
MTHSQAHKWIPLVIYGNAAIAVGLALYFFLIPLALLVFDLGDDGLKQGKFRVPPFAPTACYRPITKHGHGNGWPWARPLA